jgi:hypothetical protein
MLELPPLRRSFAVFLWTLSQYLFIFNKISLLFHLFFLNLLWIITVYIGSTHATLCKMLISIFSWFFHTIFKDLTEQILYPKCNRMHHLLRYSISTHSEYSNPRPSTAFSLSRVGMYDILTIKCHNTHLTCMWDNKSDFFKLLLLAKALVARNYHP